MIHDYRFSTNQLEVEPIFGGDRVVLPPRKLGRVRNLGWILVGIGLFATGFMVLWMGPPIAAGIEELHQQGGWFGWLSIGFGLLGLMGLVPSLGLLVAGLAVVCDRTRGVIELQDGWLTAKEKFFFISWRRRCRLQSIRRLRFGAGSTNSNESLPPVVGELATALVAERDGNTFLITVAYPHELLAKLADELASHVETEVELAGPLSPHPRTSRDMSPIEVVEGFPHEEERVWEKPADSNAVLTRHEHGIKIDTPAVGVLKGSRGLFFFGILWNGLLAVVVVAVVIGMIKGGHDAPPWYVALFLLPFVGVGIGVLLAAFNWGRRRTAMVTAQDRLLIVSESIFGQKRREWSKDEIAEICRGASGMEMNDVPVLELQVHSRAGKKFGCLSERSDDELGWIAYELNQALGRQHGARQGELFVENVVRDKEGRAVPSNTSRIILERDHAVTRIHVPPDGLGKYAALLVMGIVFCIVGCGVSLAVFWNDLTRGFESVELAKVGFFALWGTMFIGGGIAMFLAGLVAARRTIDIDLDRTRLRVRRRGVFGEKSLCWQRDELKGAKIVDSGTRVNNRRLLQLRIYACDGHHFSMMTGQDQADLALVATTIREALGVGDEAQATAV